MRLLAKFSLLLIVVLGVGLSVAGYLARRFLENNARDVVLEQARLMMETTLSMRNYTTLQVKPLFAARHLAEAGDFPPQIVPAYSAIQMFTYLRERYPAYTYREASLNPSNLRNRAVDWETDVINTFRNYPERKEITGERETPDGPTMYLARPIVVKPPCLECHSVPQRAPASMVRTYGRNNGFGWKQGEVIAAQIVSVPTALPYKIAATAFRNLTIYLALVGLAALVILNLGLTAIVIRPVERMAGMAEQISQGNLEVAELPVSGSDEVARLGRSFNRMYVSLAKAIRMLEG
jgi:HAMP domain-containing protein